MDDNKKHMLLMAAKAAGISHDGAGFISQSGLPINWIPLDDDGDALRLAVKLEMDLIINAKCGDLGLTSAYYLCGESVAVNRSDDIKSDVRLAITMAAASIGEKMP